MSEKRDWLFNTKKGVVTTFCIVLLMIFLLGLARIKTMPHDNPSYVLTVEAGQGLTPTPTALTQEGE